MKRFEGSVRCLLESPNEATLETGASAICERLAGEVEKNRMRLEKMLMLLRSYAIEAEILTPPYPAGWTVVTDGNELEALKSVSPASPSPSRRVQSRKWTEYTTDCVAGERGAQSSTCRGRKLAV